MRVLTIKIVKFDNSEISKEAIDFLMKECDHAYREPNLKIGVFDIDNLLTYVYNLEEDEKPSNEIVEALNEIDRACKSNGCCYFSIEK